MSGSYLLWGNSDSHFATQKKKASVLMPFRSFPNRFASISLNSTVTPKPTTQALPVSSWFSNLSTNSRSNNNSNGTDSSRSSFSESTYYGRDKSSLLRALDAFVTPDARRVTLETGRESGLGLDRRRGEIDLSTKLCVIFQQVFQQESFRNGGHAYCRRVLDALIASRAVERQLSRDDLAYVRSELSQLRDHCGQLLVDWEQFKGILKHETRLSLRSLPSSTLLHTPFSSSLSSSRSRNRSIPTEMDPITASRERQEYLNYLKRSCAEEFSAISSALSSSSFPSSSPSPSWPTSASLADRMKSSLDEELLLASGSGIGSEAEKEAEKKLIERIQERMDNPSAFRHQFAPSDDEDDVSESEMEVAAEQIGEAAMDDDQENPNPILAARFEELSPEEETLVKNALSGEPNEKLLVEYHDIPITRRLMHSLKPNAWLNDEIISMLMLLLMDRDTELCKVDPTRRHSHYFNNFFVNKLVDCGGYNFSNVKRWGNKFKVFDMDKIFCPININSSHWTLAVIFVQQKIIKYYDSMGSEGKKYLLALRRYMKDEADRQRKDKGLDVHVDESEWTLISAYSSEHVPQQTNGFDCGVFTITYADFLTDGLDFSEFSQNDMPLFRNKICASILRGKLQYPLPV